MRLYTVFDYVNHSVWPSLAAVAAGLVLILVSAKLLRSRIRRAKGGQVSLWARPFSMAALFLLLYFGMLLAVLPVTLLYFTLPAVFHLQAPIVTVQGTLERIDQLPVLLPGPSGMTRHATLKVDGTDYYIFEAAELEKGDEITLSHPDGTRLVTGYTAKHVPKEPEPPLRTLAFSYALYRRTLFQEPVFLILFLLCIVCFACLGRKNQPHSLMPRGQVASVLIGLLIGPALLAATAARPLIRGVALIRERESDAVTSLGIIQDVQEAQGTAMKFHTDYGTCFGCEITIDGETYLIPTVGDLAAGDMVTFRYLPASKCILACTGVDTQASPSD